MVINKARLWVAVLAVLTAFSAALADMGGIAAARYRWLWTASSEDAAPMVFDNLSLLSWQLGTKATISSNKLSLEFRLGNDWMSGEGASWSSGDKTAIGGLSVNKLCVHLAYASLDPGYVYADVGVIPILGSSTLDLMERSLNSGSYGEAAYRGWPGWQRETDKSLMAVRLGVPVLKGDIRLALEFTASIVDERIQMLTLLGDPEFEESPRSNSSSIMMMFNAPLDIRGDSWLRVTPELTVIRNRNFNSESGVGDHEVIGGLWARWMGSRVTVELSGGYGAVDNSASGVGRYGTTHRVAPVMVATPEDAEAVMPDYDPEPYDSRGLVLGVGATVAVRRGMFALDFKYGSSHNASGGRKSLTNANDIYVDFSYIWNIYPSLTVTPRWRVYTTSYEEAHDGIKKRTDHRLELMMNWMVRASDKDD